MRKLLPLVALLLAACTAAITQRGAPIMMYPTLPTNLGQTVCSFDNQPVVLMDSAVLTSNEAEIILVHEQTHAQRMRAYRGGCWVFTKRYRTDSAFRVKEEIAAYCAEGRFAMERGRNAESAWQRIKFVMRENFNVRLTEAENCLFQSWTPNNGER
jgi:hypothetical protein